jgi:hypothetical protein
VSPKNLRVFIDLCCGVGRTGRSVSNITSSAVLLIELEHGPNHDVGNARVCQDICSWVSAGAVWGLHTQDPCSSWSRILGRPGGPPKLRTDDMLWGLSGLHPTWERKVLIANRLIKNVCKILSAALARFTRCADISVSRENPARSRSWAVPPMLRVTSSPDVELVECDACQWAPTRWKKPTWLRCFGANFAPMGKKCRGKRCSRTGRKHVQLCGKDDKGRFRTAKAQVYSWAFARELALCHIVNRAERYQDYELYTVSPQYACCTCNQLSPPPLPLKEVFTRRLAPHQNLPSPIVKHCAAVLDSAEWNENIARTQLACRASALSILR